MTVIILIMLAGIFYAATFAAAASAKNESRLNALPAVLAAAALACQGAALGLRFAESGTFFATSYDLLEAFVFAFALAILLCRVLLKIRFLEFFSALPISILTLLPLFCPVFSDILNGACPAKSGNEFATWHGILAALSYAGLGTASVFAAMYLIQKRLLLNRDGGKFGRLMPSISALHKMLRAALTCAFVFMLVSMFFALAAIGPMPVSGAEILKFSTGTLIFGIQGVLCYIVKRRTLPESALAKFTIAGTVLCVLLLLPIELKDFIL